MSRKKIGKEQRVKSHIFFSGTRRKPSDSNLEFSEDEACLSEQERPRDKWSEEASHESDGSLVT
jgi:hypothetical protein